MGVTDRAHTLSAQPGLYDVLLCLADFCPGSGVRHCATRLLDALPTNAATLQALRDALSGREPDQALARLLDGDVGGPARLARLLYMLQARPRAWAATGCAVCLSYQVRALCLLFPMFATMCLMSCLLSEYLLSLAKHCCGRRRPACCTPWRRRRGMMHLRCSAASSTRAASSACCAPWRRPREKSLEVRALPVRARACGLKGHPALLACGLEAPHVEASLHAHVFVEQGQLKKEVSRRPWLRSPPGPLVRTTKGLIVTCTHSNVLLRQ